MLEKMETKPADELKKKWFIDRLNTSLRRKMRIVPPTSYDDAYDRAMNLESESKTLKRKKSKSSSESDESFDEDSSSNDESNKKVQALQKDMERVMHEFKMMKRGARHRDEGKLWCMKCKESRHTKGVCLKKSICDIC